MVQKHHHWQIGLLLAVLTATLVDSLLRMVLHPKLVPLLRERRRGLDRRRPSLPDDRE